MRRSQRSLRSHTGETTHLALQLSAALDRTLLNHRRQYCAISFNSAVTRHGASQNAEMSRLSRRFSWCAEFILTIMSPIYNFFRRLRRLTAEILGKSRQPWGVAETKISAGPSRITGPAELLKWHSNRPINALDMHLPFLRSSIGSMKVASTFQVRTPVRCSEKPVTHSAFFKKRKEMETYILAASLPSSSIRKMTLRLICLICLVQGT
jgi:hypothetical protein